MPRTISTDFREQMYATEMDYVALVILDIAHPDIAPSVIRVVNNNQDISYGGNTYTAVSFKFTPPEESRDELQPARVIISNIERTLMTLIRSISSPPTVTANVILVAPNGDITVEQGPWNFELSNVSYTDQTVSGSLVYKFFKKQYLSNIRVNVTNFPSLYQV